MCLRAGSCEPARRVNTSAPTQWSPRRHRRFVGSPRHTSREVIPVNILTARPPSFLFVIHAGAPAHHAACRPHRAAIDRPNGQRANAIAVIAERTESWSFMGRTAARAASHDNMAHR